MIGCSAGLSVRRRRANAASTSHGSRAIRAVSRYMRTIPQAIADWILASNFGVIGFLLLVNVLLLIAGNFMEPSSIILIMAPMLFPAAKRLGIDPVHFGIVIDVNMEVGLCHPPVGLNLYVASTIARLGITDLTMAVLPWLGPMFIFLSIVTYWPELTLYLPRVLGML